ncbi:protein FAR1-RELATED SEQUENCE 6-like [Gastrolobium bilobum]|uniref:protein FAR1-RELATED SEQUENCE 6-like n=1 Tax=Gastrolobium bilobum TaxID=150636 RepID=UPI002AB2407C|nr:protein FAR1-RELATED SEQUENCE 6-like [Gastrolobium bilobum]
MEISQITTIEDMNESVVSLDDIVELEKESDELSEDGQCEIMNQDKDSDRMQDNCQEIMGDDSEFNEPPILGRVFETAEEAYDFYNDFAKVKGFGIRKRYFNKSRRTQQPCLWNYVCSKQGVKNLHDKRIDVSNVKRRRDTRTDCLAMFQIKLVNELWKVEKFNDSHNHPLINTPSKLAEDGTLRSVFWADGRSRASYGQFGEVLVFDVTYKTNKFKFPFFPFCWG